MNSCVALRGEFDARFPDLKGLARDADRIPGRELAEIVSRGLRQAGIAIAGPVCEEPFFTLRCEAGGQTITLLCYLYAPDTGTWVVEAPQHQGFLSRLLRRPRTEGLRRVLEALHQTLLREPRVREMRWFAELPVEPFGKMPYGVGPFAG